MSLPLNKYRKVAVDFCSDQGAMKEHSLGSVTEEQRRAGQKDQDLVCNGFSGNDTRYLRLSQDFFTQNSRFFEEKGEESIRWVEMGLDDEEATLAQWQRVNDQAEVIQWYRFFIGAKLDRAASGIDEMNNEDWGRPEQSDANRTARILMVAIDRSIAAWRVLLSVFPEKEETILRILSLLAQIRRRVEEVFPRWSIAGPDVEW